MRACACAGWVRAHPAALLPNVGARGLSGICYHQIGCERGASLAGLPSLWAGARPGAVIGGGGVTGVDGVQ